MLAGLLGFFAGIALTLYLLRAEIYHGQKVGYGPNDIHPDNGLGCCRSVPHAQYKPDIRPEKQ